MRINMDIYCSHSFNGLLDFRGILQEKKALKSWVMGKDVKDVYFFHEGYCELANWLMLQLSKLKNLEFHYVPIARSYLFNRIEQDRGMQSAIRALYCRLIWGYKPIYPIQDKYCGVFPQKFYDSLHINKAETIKIHDSIGKAILPDEFDENGIVLLDNPYISSKNAEIRYSQILEDSIRPIMEGCPIYFKNHPGRAKKIGLEVEIKEIPSFISGNLLTRRFRAFVGVNSALLCEAANDGSMAICMAYLVDLDESTRKNIVRYHQMLSDKIYYPKSIKDFFNILDINKSKME